MTQMIATLTQYLSYPFVRYALIVGVLIALLVDEQYEEFEKIYTLNRSLSLPTSLEEIEITPEQWEACINRIPDMSDVAHYPYRVAPQMLRDAMKKLNERRENHAL